MKAILFYYRQQRTYEVYSHDVDDLLADVLVPGLMAQGKEAYAINQTGLHDGPALECDRCRRIAIAFMAVQGSLGKTIASEAEASDPSAYFTPVSGIGEMSTRVETPTQVKKEKPPKVKPPPKVKEEKKSPPPKPKPVPIAPTRQKEQRGILLAASQILPTPANFRRWFSVRAPAEKLSTQATGQASGITAQREGEYKDAWEDIQEAGQATPINPKIIKLFPILVVIILAVVGIYFLFNRPSSSADKLVNKEPTITNTQKHEELAILSFSSTPTSSPVPSSTLTPISPPAFTPTPFILVILTPPTLTPTIPLPPSPTPTEESGCVQALKVTLDDVGKTMCVTGTILKVDPRENGFLILFGVEKGVFYFISYEGAWPIAKPGVCVMATGKVQRLSSSPVIVLGVSVPLLPCTQ